MLDRLLGRADRDPAVADRIPPGQYRTEKFPVLHYGSVPKTDLATWDFRVWGEVDSPFTLSWDEFKSLPRKKVGTDIHCVTRWSKLDTEWEGVPIQEILQRAQLRPSARFVVAHAEQGYTANVPLEVLDDEDVLLADTFGGGRPGLEHGWPGRRARRRRGPCSCPPRRPSSGPPPSVGSRSSSSTAGRSGSSSRRSTSGRARS